MDENMALTVKKPLNILSLASEPQLSEPLKFWSWMKIQINSLAYLFVVYTF